MNNYQLYRTNVALGGQLKWDISIDNGSNGLYVSDFHITPISRRVPYNRYAQDHLLNYSHLENIKSFYKSIEGSFYQPYADPMLVNEQPYLYKATPGHETIDLHDSTFDMGVQRSQCSVTGKEFEAFCPVWLEDMYDEDGNVKPLKFSFYLRNKTRNGQIVDLAAKHLVLDFSTGGDTDVHTRFIKYLGNYIKDIQLDDKVIKIDFDKPGGVITGVDALTGLVKTIDISNLTKDLLAQERLLMESDSMIIDRFATKHMIAKQLFNFNFVFDIEEFFTQQILRMMKGGNLYMDVRISVGELKNNDLVYKELEIKDFYTNYDFISKERVPDLIGSNVLSRTINVFEGLSDHTDVDILAKNKMVQTICHWSLASNNEYLFNVYDGLAGYVMTIDSKTGTAQASPLTKVNQTAPDIWSDKQVDALNNIGWLNICKIGGWRAYIDIEQNVDDWIPKASPISIWNNMCKYDEVAVDELKFDAGVKYAAIVMVDSSLSDDDTATIGWDKIRRSHTLGEIARIKAGERGCIVVRYIESASLLLLITKRTDAEALDGLTFAGLQKLIPDNVEYLVSDERTLILDALKKMMVSVAQPKVITFDKILGYMRAMGPDVQTKEVSHYEIKSNKKLFRLDGYIKPSFVSPTKNNMYVKTCYTQDSDFVGSSFAKYTKTGYALHYPSVDYYPFASSPITLSEEDELGRVIENVDSTYVQGKPHEFKWFTFSKILVLDKEMNFRLEGDGTKSVKELILEHLKEVYATTSDSQAYYIYDLYNMTYDWEYLSPTEIDKYVYTIKLVLK